MLKKQVSSYFLYFLFGSTKKYSVYLQKIFWKGMQSKFLQKKYYILYYYDNKKITWLYESRIIYSLLCQCRLS